ncbi:MAG: DUF58 domain-containing protein [Balneolaceae bacterium]
MNFIKSLFVDQRFFLALVLVCISYILGFFFVGFEALGDVILIILVVSSITDILLIYSQNNGLKANRITPKRLSNGDENTIPLMVRSSYNFSIECSIVDEIPHQFQIRNFEIRSTLKEHSEKTFTYDLRPTKRGEFDFGNVNIFVKSKIGLFSRRFVFDEKESVPVYPSFIQMRKFEMYAISNRLTDIGIKKIRRLGHTMEFDQIKEYVPGDDIRSINWKATARSQNLMVNQFQDERSQQVVNVIDMGRVMKMPFDGLNLLEYAINTSLVISNIALIKDDKAGLVTFSNKEAVVVRPEKKRTHIRKIQESLYNLNTNFMESDYERLIINLRTHLNQRSLVLLYTNFETFSSMQRQLPYLKRIARDHLLVTIFFENTELTSLLEKDSENLDDIYVKTVAEKFNYEKKQIIKSLTQHGIHSLLTPPKELSVNAINKYLELKARGLI